ncbi:3-isopropylmalate dehydratase small subunit [Sinimarinibacterium sp. CAU 1509]|uniref:3-isopropylmalate dehydratase small subunit n=1 Tax=Sinimarinibacterium sp. CAU 1509 TaxID=2562283 RepID=UPI0010AB9D19|nr:3-isopropylmalate dehydratase small subunit [Sinimarinibacterium sp. CAU 1509]TJY62235.1 3-isopropylmalate dehydratase small subunit [Sinimarinibacterium sp. CAU 1509]
MRAFTVLTSKVMPLDRPNVDTDAIIPKQYLKSIRRTGFGPFLFDDWRYLDPGTLEVDPATRRPNPDFVLNDPKHAGAQILIARENFGCGSSREHAVWALDDYGFRAVIAPSFADIFFSNCFKNGLLPVVLKADEVQAIFEGVASDPGKQFTIDLPAQELRLPCGKAFKFEINPHHKHNMVNGLDEIGLTLQQADVIRAYEARRAQQAPWLFN